MKRQAILGLCLALACSAAPVVSAGTLTIVNDTPADIINILATPVNKQEKPFYWRLDLPPKGNDVVDSPDENLSLRVDTGLALCSFPDVPLGNARRIIFSREPRIIIEYASGNSNSVTGTCKSMIPQTSAPAVCNLDRLRPAMSMKDVCAILPAQMPQDDSGAFLTALGFGGLNWAARLIPSTDGPVSESSLLDHLELRRPLDAASLTALVNHLFQKGYIPWQAEFPGIDMEFRSRGTPEQEKATLLNAMNGFVKAHVVRGHTEHALRERCAQASIIMAPRSLLPELEYADEPPAETQIYTIILRPCTNTLILDLAVYGKSYKAK